MSKVNQEDRFARKGPVSKPIKPETPDVEIDPLFAARLERVERAHAKYGISYFPSDYAERLLDMQQVFCQNYMRSYPESNEITLLSLKRLLLKYPQYENEKGEIDKNVKCSRGQGLSECMGP